MKWIMGQSRTCQMNQVPGRMNPITAKTKNRHRILVPVCSHSRAGHRRVSEAESDFAEFSIESKRFGVTICILDPCMNQMHLF